MNKIFKVIFNKTTGQFVVVSELSKAKGKASSSTDKRVGVSSLVTKLQYQAKAALILGLLGVSSVAYAAAPTYGENDGIGSPIAIGTGSNASGEANIALGEKSSATDTSKAKKQMIAIGGNATVTGSQAIAIGGDTVASGFGSIAIGGDDADGLTEYKELRYNPTSGKVETRKSNESAYQKTTASGVGSISIGPKSQSLQDGTVAVGVLATAAGTESVSIGVKSASKGKSSVALGAGSTALADNSVAIGNKAVAESDGGVALGKDSIANIASGLKGYDVLTNKETTETNSIWKATHAAVSVGKADGTVTRQIKGVAAGSSDTDAVNVAQLKKVTLKVSGDSGSGSVALNSQTLNIEGQDGIVSQATGQKVIVKLDSTTKGKIDNALSKTEAGNTYLKKTDASTTYATKTELNGKAAGTNTFKFKIQDGAATATDAKTWTLSTSDTVTFKAGDNLDVSAANGVITYSLDNATKTSINSIASKVNTSDFNTYKTEVTTALSGKADTGLSNITDAGNTVIKNQAKQAINVVGANSRVTVNKDTTVASGVDTYKVSVDVSDLATKTEVGAKLDSSAFTKDNVTNKVNTGTVRSTTLDISGTGKVVGSDLTVNLKNGAIDTAHLSTAVQNSITNAKTKVAVNPASGGILKLDTSTDTTQPTTYTLSIDEAKLKEKAGTTDLATEYAKADASNIDNHISEWKTKLGVSDLTATNLSYKGNETSATTKTTSLATGLTFASSDLDIAATDGGNLSFTLKNQAVSKDNLESTVANKIDLIGAGTVASNSAGTVTGGAVHTAITGAKTKVALATDSASALTLEKTETADLNANTYTLKLNAEQLKQDLGVQNLDLNYQGNSTGGTKQKTTLSDGLKFTSDDLTITAKTGGEINLALKADTLNNTAKLKYKANGDATAKETALSTGLNFNSASTDALTIGTEADGKVNFTINTGAFADTGLAAKNGDSNKLATVGGVATAISSVNTALTTLINNKASKSLNDITAEGKNVIKGLIDVKKADGDNNLVTVTSTNVGEVETHTISVTKDAVKTALNGDFAAKDASNLVEDDVNKWKNKLGVANLNLKYKGNDGSAAKETTLSTGLAFNSDDLTITTGDSGNLTLTLKNGAVSKANLETEVANKIDRIGTGSVENNNTGTVTGDTVYKAINEAKNSLTSGGMTFAGNSGTNAKVPLAGTLSIKGEGTVQGGFASNNITVVSDDTSKTLTVKLAENLSNIKNIELKGTAGKDGKIGVDADGNVTVINGINGTNGSATPSKVVTEATIGTQTIKYTANSNADKKSVSLSSGFNFLNGTNTTATVGENGQVTYNLNPELTGITSIGGANGSGKLSFDVNKQINVNGGTITNLASGLTGGKVTDSNQNHVATLGDLKTLSAWEILGNGTAAKTAAGAANTQAKTLVDQTRNRVDFSGGGAAVVTVKEKESHGYQVEVNVKQGSVTLPTTGTPTTLDDLKVDAGNEGVATVTTVVDTVKKTAEILTGKGLNFEGETTGDAVARKLGETLKLQGGATGDLSSNNIAVKKNNSNDGYDIKLAQTLTGLKSATFGEANDQTVINKDGLTVKGANDSTLVSLTDNAGTPTLEFAKNGAAGTGVITGLKDLTDNADGSSATNKNYVDTKLSALTNTGFVVGSDKAKNGAAVTSLSETHALGKQLDIVGASSAFTGEVAGSEVTASAGNIVTKVEKDGDKTKVQIGLNKNLKLEQVTFGSDPEQTTIGKDGVTVKGANTETKITDSGVAVTGKNGVNGKNGVEIKSDDSGNGSIVINGKDGQNSSQATISVSQHKDATTTDPSTKGLDNNIDSRIQYQDGNTTHQLATLDDGLVFQGNDGQAVTRKLNTTLTIKGTVDSVTDTLSDGKNIGVVKDASAGANGLVVKLAKNLTALDSATFGAGDNSAVLDADSLTFKAKGEAADAPLKTLTISNDKTKGGSITGLEDRTVVNSPTDYGIDGRAATESAVKEVSDRVNKAADGTTGVVVYTDQDGKRIVKDNGQFYLTKADGTADKTKPTVPADKVLVSIVNPDNLSDKQAVGNANKLANLAKGTVSTASTEAITGAQLHDLVTHVGLTPNDTKTGFNALSFDAITASVASGSAVARTDLVNAVKDIIIAVNKGTVTQGDNNSSVTRQLGQTLKLNGGATGTLSDNNIGVVVNDQTNADGFNIKLAKDLKNLASAEFVGTGDNAEKTTLSSTGMKVETVDGNNKAEATYGKDGLTVKGADGNDAISLTNKAGANNTTTPALEFAKGADGKGTGAISGLKDIDPSDTDGSKATNKNYVDDKFNSLKEAGIKVGADQGDVKTHKLGNQLDIKAGAITTGSGDTEVKYSGDNLITKVSQDTTSGKTTVEIGLKEKLALKELTVDDTAEKGKVKLAEDAVTVVNKDSKDAVSVTTDAEGDGKVVVNNKAGESAVEVGHNEKGGLIKLTGVKAAGTAAPTAEISVVGNKAADSNQGLDTTNKIESRISYNDGNTEHKLATLDDGLTFSGDDDQDVTRKLGTELTIKGGKSTGLTENNIGVVKDTTTGANGLVVKLAKDLTNLNSAKFGTDGNGATITSEGTEIVATAADGTKASATYALEGMKLVDGNNTSTTTAGGSTVTNGTTTTDTTAEGVKVSSNDKDDKSESTYGKDGLTVKGADGKDAINLTNKAGANNTATPTLEFAKGTDGKGTGAISGLQDIDPLDTDGSKATNKNYVDSRIADLDAGKPFEYFDNQGNKVVRGKDNQFYKATDIDGKVYVEGKGYVLPADKDNQNAKGVEAVKSGDVVINAMPNSEPMGLSNIRSGLGLSPITETKDNQTVETAITKEAAQTAVDSLVTQTGSRLNNAATVRDLQALAQAGVDFTGNNAAENKDVHRPLGTKLTIEGEATTANQTKAQFGETAADNIHVEAKGAENKLVVSLSKDLKNLKTVTASDSIQVGTDANGVKITPDATTTTKTEGTGADKKVTTVTAGAEGTSIVQKDATNQPLKSAEYKLDGSKVDDGKGNTTEVKAGGLTAKDADSTTKVDANGMDVKSDDPNDKSAATYGKDGLTVKGNDGKDAISLTSTTAGGKTTNTLALNGKDGKDAVSITSGADGTAPEISFAKNGEDGTGSITGLKDVERNPDGTAKDKTQAANAGYVDDRLKEMNEGKPFEYFEKDPVTGEVKTETVDGKQVPVTLVRGKDGKFYKESDLKGKVFDPATNTYKNADGTPATLTEVASNNVTVQAMPSPTGKPLEMGNVGSGLGLDDSTTTNATALTPEQAQTAIAGSGKDGKGGLLTKTGSSLNNVATVKDLQALAQAGLDFVGNETTTTAVHRPLGTKLVVQGETDTANQTLAQFGATAKDNIYVDTDATNNKLVVKMTEDLKNINSLTTKPVDNPDGTKISTKLTSTGTVVSKVDPAKLDADGKPTPVETANYGLTTELKKTDADGKVTTSTSAPTGTTLSEVDKDGNKLREAEYALDGTKVTLKDPVTGATKEISTGVDGTKVTSKDPATGVTKETTTGVDGTTVKVTDQNNPNNNKSAEYGVDGTALKAKDAQGNDISADYKVGGAMVKDKDNTTEIKPDGMTVKSTDEADKSEAKYGKDGLSIVGPKGKDGKDGISLGYKPDTDANGQLTGTSTPTLEFGKGEKDPDGNDKGTGSITGLKDVERNPDGTAKDRTAAANAGYVDERLAEANATKPLEYFGTDGKKLVLGQDGKFYKPEDLEGKVYVKRKDGTEGYFNSEEKDNPTAKPVDLKNKAVDPQTVTIKAMPSDASNTPITMSNVGSGLGLKDDAESNKTALTPADAQKAIAGDNKDGKGGLLAQTGNALNNVATVKDLQAIAQAGLDFTGNNTATTVHRPLGTKLTVEGEGKWNGKDSAANNLYVEAQEADNKLVVKMNKDLTNLNSVTLGTATMTGKDNTINLTGAGAQVVEEFVKWDPVTKQPIRDKDGNLQKYKEKVDPRVKLSGIADGDISPNSTDAVNGRQVYALTNGNQVEQKKDGSTATYAKNKDGSVITEVKRDKSGNPVVDADGNEIVQAKEYTLTTYNVEGQTEFVTNSVITAVHNMNEQGIKFFHTNDGVAEPINQASNGIDSSASGTHATAVGYKAVAAGDNALAMGKGATASGKNSIAIGTGNQVIANKSGAFGDPNIIRGVQIGTDSAGNPIYKGIDGSYAFGNDNVITSSNTFVLGNNVNNKRDSNGALTWMSAIPEGTVENSVYLGNNTTATAGDGSQTGSLKNWKQDGSRGSTTTAGSTGTVSSATVGNMIYGGFAGATANGVVSVGAAGDERRIQNVAAGEISSTSTDAINGSQLYNVAHRLGAKLESEGRQLRAGIAATTAMSNIPQVTLPGKSTLGAGIGTFEGQNAIAVGFSRMSDNGRVILKVSAGATSQGKYNAGAGIALQW
ncbi:YadA-like family protein [Glaesserella parasuis]|uniref:YadA-like family protein n=1 Tax=Glaesserella parasuis TaxID=738 RepID=UPI002436873E|nr:YadA-like family protein [Glaesserella parasuis]MDG6230646.1 YadA-like family protein [Glaesserella parasuis]